jgi:TolB-like protein
MFASMLTIGVWLSSYWQFTHTHRFASASQESAIQSISIAVLPFINMSGDATQDFFSDGITEEITAGLARIPDLRVVARTSAFQFKGENKDMRAVGHALGATHLIEGAVRKAGTRLRITAQLIKTDDGTHMWSESYDRELTDIFAIQEDIATAIASALRRPLGLAPSERLIANRSIDPESYEQFLRAWAMIRSRNQNPQARGTAVVEMLEQVTARNPNYAPAWGLLALVTPDLGAKKEKAAREAIRLDARNALGYAALAGIQYGRGDLAGAEKFYRKALSLDPNEPDVLDAFSNRLALAGRIKEALSIRERLQVLEPFTPVYNYITANVLLIGSQTDRAIAVLETLPLAANRNISLAEAYAKQGRFDKAGDTLLLPGQDDRSGRQPQMEEAARLLRNLPRKGDAAILPAFDQQLSFVYLYVGASNRVLDYQERQEARYPNLGSAEVRYLWGAEFAPVRKTERFKTFVRKIRLVDYWRASGWADLCHPMGADDFVCE